MEEGGDFMGSRSLGKKDREFEPMAGPPLKKLKIGETSVPVDLILNTEHLSGRQDCVDHLMRHLVRYFRRDVKDENREGVSGRLWDHVNDRVREHFRHHPGDVFREDLWFDLCQQLTVYVWEYFRGFIKDTDTEDSDDMKDSEDTDDLVDATSNIRWCGIYREEGYVEYLSNSDAIEPEWDDAEICEEAMLRQRLHVSSGSGITASHCPGDSEILEIFSMSIHWEENMCGMKYHLYGNVFLQDMENCCLKAINRSFRHPFTASNGDNLPLRGLVRSLFCEPSLDVFVCLMGHRLDSRLNCCENESQVLIKKDLTLYGCNFSLTEGYNYPVERAFVGAKDRPFFKIHYSVIEDSFVVGVEVRLICRDTEARFDKICINGQLSVRWLQFEKLVAESDKKNYSIMLLDTEQQDSLSSSVSLSLGECLPIWRSKLAVPYGFSLVFDADIQTDNGYEFKGRKDVCVDDGGTIFARTFGDGLLKMQISLVNYYCAC